MGLLVILHLVLVVSWQRVTVAERRPAVMSLPSSGVDATPTPVPTPSPRLLCRSATEVEE